MAFEYVYRGKILIENYVTRKKVKKSCSPYQQAPVAWRSRQMHRNKYMTCVLYVPQHTEP